MKPVKIFFEKFVDQYNKPNISTNVVKKQYMDYLNHFYALRIQLKNSPFLNTLPFPSPTFLFRIRFFF